MKRNAFVIPLTLCLLVMGCSASLDDANSKALQAAGDNAAGAVKSVAALQKTVADQRTIIDAQAKTLTELQRQVAALSNASANYATKGDLTPIQAELADGGTRNSILQRLSAMEGQVATLNANNGRQSADLYQALYQQVQTMRMSIDATPSQYMTQTDKMVIQNQVGIFAAQILDLQTRMIAKGF
jgi:hypothetical protein